MPPAGAPACEPRGGPFDLVPPAILVRPYQDELRYVERDQCALLLDGYLRRLARHEASCRRVLGTLARALIDGHGQHALGFARLDDYARERLGLSGRELQSLAQVAAALARLPLIAAAFDRGELSWSHVRVLATVATPESEARWLGRARGRTVRAFEALVGAMGGGGDDGSAACAAKSGAAASAEADGAAVWMAESGSAAGPEGDGAAVWAAESVPSAGAAEYGAAVCVAKQGAAAGANACAVESGTVARPEGDGIDAGVGEGGAAARAHGVGVNTSCGEDRATAAGVRARLAAACEEDAGLVDGEPEVAFHLPCPRRLRPRWRAAVELARRVAGEALSPWRAAEAIAAEGLSAPEGLCATEGLSVAEGSFAAAEFAAPKAFQVDRPGAPDAAVAHLAPATVEHPDLARMAQADPGAVAQADPATAVQVDPGTVGHPDPGALVQPDPARIAQSDPGTVVQSDPGGMAHPDPGTVVQPDPAAVERSDPTAGACPDPALVAPVDPATGASPSFLARDEPHPGRGDPNETHAAYAYLDWSAVTEAIPEEVAALGRDTAELDAFALDARLRAVLCALHRIDWQTGRLLRLFCDLRLYLLLGFVSLARYVRERLGLSIRKARALIAVERATWQAPDLAAAYEAGRISWPRALAILPVLSETQAGAWVARANAVTLRRLIDEVTWAQSLQDLTPLCMPVAPPPAGAVLDLVALGTEQGDTTGVGASGIGTPGVGRTGVGRTEVPNTDVGNTDVGSRDVGSRDVGSREVGSREVGSTETTEVESTGLGTPGVGTTGVEILEVQLRACASRDGCASAGGGKGETYCGGGVYGSADACVGGPSGVHIASASTRTAASTSSGLVWPGVPPAGTSNGTAAEPGADAGANAGAEKGAEKGDTPESTSARAGVCGTSTAADTCGGTSPAWSGGWREGVDAEIYFRGPASVVALLRAAIAAFQASGEPAWQGCERLLAHVIAAWEELPRHRDPVFARDGWRCAVPGCSARRNLHDHHLRFRSRGGEHTRDNRLAVCAWHHLRGIHGGRVRAWGTAPDQVNWELGVRPGGPPLLRLVGDRYVTTEEAYKTTADCPDDKGEPCHAEESQVTAEESVTAEEKNQITADFAELHHSGGE